MSQDLNDIIIFARVVDSGSFTKAARSLNMLKSTVSRRISRLEDALGARLLQRTTRSLSLTDAGRILYERASRIEAELDDAQAAVKAMYGAPIGNLRVTAPATMVSFQYAIFDFLKEYPQVTVDLDLTNRYVDMVAEGYDLAARAGNTGDTSLIARKLSYSHAQLVASPQYIQTHGRPNSPDELKVHSCIVTGFQKGRATWALHSTGGTARVNVAGRLRVTDLLCTYRAAIAGMGIAILPILMIGDDLATGKLEVVLDEYHAAKSQLNLVYPSRRFVTPALRCMITFMLERNFAPQLSP